MVCLLFYTSILQHPQHIALNKKTVHQREERYKKTGFSKFFPTLWPSATVFTKQQQKKKKKKYCTFKFVWWVYCQANIYKLIEISYPLNSCLSKINLPIEPLTTGLNQLHAEDFSPKSTVNNHRTWVHQNKSVRRIKRSSQSIPHLL